LKENPEHRIWLEHNVEPRFWSKFKSLEAEWQRVLTRLARMIKRDPVESQPEQEKQEEATSDHPKYGIVSDPYSISYL
jgi:hypothetical protein